MQHEAQMTNIAIQGATLRQQAQAAIGQTALVTKSAQDATEVVAEGEKATVMTMFGVSEGASKTLATLGYWGIPLIGVITAILMGLLNSAKATASQSSSSNVQKPKLVSGMLTFDEGNIGSYVGTDGHTYRASSVDSLPAGVSLVSHPIATTVNGSPALIGERGPEIVIGRKTTRHIMMNEPQLLSALAHVDRLHSGRRLRTFDEGTDNLSSLLPANNSMESENERREREQQMLYTLDNLSKTILVLQQQLQGGIRAEINMYGRTGLRESLKKADNFMSRHGG
jgi:hypothetical protein